MQYGDSLIDKNDLCVATHAITANRRSTDNTPPNMRHNYKVMFTPKRRRNLVWT